MAGVEELCRVRGVQREQVEMLDPGDVEVRRLSGAHPQYDADRGVTEPARHEHQHLTARRIHPVRVVDDDRLR